MIQSSENPCNLFCSKTSSVDVISGLSSLHELWCHEGQLGLLSDHGRIDHISALCLLLEGRHIYQLLIVVMLLVHL